MGIRAVVVGGSLGGLSSALALRCVDCDVDVFPRCNEKSRCWFRSTKDVSKRQVAKFNLFVE
jgi:2-polyprenyl-6-methoxyphenol hydroxylase-like FAD-dependent oxidoreductase